MVVVVKRDLLLQKGFSISINPYQITSLDRATSLKHCFDVRFGAYTDLVSQS
jgi:hypothetical protein